MAGHHDQFRRVCGCFPTGVTVTTLIGTDDEPHGITVSSFTSVSLDPLLVLICIDRRSQIVQHLDVGCPLAINVLSSNQHEISIRFSKRWENRFAGIAWYPGTTGAPLLYNTSAALECRLQQIIEAGDHLIVIGFVVAGFSTDRSPLIYLRSSYNNVAARTV